MAFLTFNYGWDILWVQRFGHMILSASIVISFFMLTMSYLQLTTTRKKELAASDALNQAKEALCLARETGGELDSARRKLIGLARVTGTTILTELMAANFYDRTTLKVQLGLSDQVIGTLREIGLSEDEIGAAKEMWSKGVGLLYCRAIRCALEGRTDPNKMNMKAGPEQSKASRELGKMVNSREWQAPSPDEIQIFIEKGGVMNEEVKELIDDYRYFLKTGDIRRREFLESLTEKQ